MHFLHRQQGGIGRGCDFLAKLQTVTLHHAQRGSNGDIIDSALLSEPWQRIRSKPQSAFLRCVAFSLRTRGSLPALSAVVLFKPLYFSLASALAAILQLWLRCMSVLECAGGHFLPRYSFVSVSGCFSGSQFTFASISLCSLDNIKTSQLCTRRKRRAARYSPSVPLHRTDRPDTESNSCLFLLMSSARRLRMTHYSSPCLCAR